VLLFCTDGFFKDPKVEYIALQAVAAGVPLIVVQEWNVSCGGVLTLGGVDWNFLRIFGEGQCKHKQLACIPQGTEAMRHRGLEDLPYLVRTYLNVIVEQLSAAESKRLKTVKAERPSTLLAGRLSFMASRRSTASASQEKVAEWPDFSEKFVPSSRSGGGGGEGGGSSSGADPVLLDLLEAFGTPDLISHIAALGVTTAADTTLLSDKELVAVGFTKSHIKGIRVIAAHAAGTGGSEDKGKGRDLWAAPGTGLGAEGTDVDKALAAKGKGRDLWAAPGTNVGVEGTSLDGAPALVLSEMRLGMSRAAEQKAYTSLVKARIDQRRAAEEASRARTEAALDAADEGPKPCTADAGIYGWGR
jgi:hypothetical protein